MVVPTYLISIYIDDARNDDITIDLQQFLHFKNSHRSIFRIIHETSKITIKNAWNSLFSGIPDHIIKARQIMINIPDR